MLIRLNVLPYNKYNLIFHKNRLKLFIIKIRVIINLICLFFFYKGYYSNQPLRPFKYYLILFKDIN